MCQLIKIKFTKSIKKVTTDTENEKEKIISKSNPHGNQTSEFQLNQKVYKRLYPRNKNKPKFSGPYKIIEMLDHNRVDTKY